MKKAQPSLWDRQSAKKRPKLFRFMWQKDGDGYDLSADRQLIRRRGGPMATYDPREADVPLHETFANLRLQIWWPDEGRDPIPPGAPFHQRRFEDEEEALLAFVTEFGFLAAGPEADSESVLYLSRQQRDLSVFFDFSMPGRRSDEDAPIEFKGPLIRVRVLSEKRAARPRLILEPESLRAWLWFRVAEDLVAGVNWSGPPCLFCEKPMPRGSNNYRLDAKFCSTHCKTYFNRRSKHDQTSLKRKAQAMRLRRQTIEETDR
jgi:hypothetical protein